MRSMKRCLGRLVLFLSAALLLSGAAQTQDAPPAQQPENQDKNQNPGTPPEQPSNATGTTAAPNPGSPIDTQIHVAGKAVPWLGTSSPLLTLGTAFHLSPRVDLTVNDTFAQVRSRQFFPPNILAVDQQAGNLIQNNFLQNAGSFLMNEVSATVTDTFTPRTFLTFSSAYRYAYDTGNNPNLPNYAAIGHTIGATAALTHALTPRQNIGVLYSLESLRATNVAGLPNGTNTFFHTVGFFYANQLSRTWWLKGQIGVQYADYRGNAPNFLTLGGGVTLVKTFTYSNFALAYNRARTETNFVTPRIGDRADAAYSINLTKRLVWNSGIGYYAETGAEPRTKGNYGGTGLAFELLPNFFLTGNYNHTFQRASTQQLLSGIRNTYIAGLRWEPRALPGH